MAMGCGATCAKWTLFVFNLVFWLTGAAILGVGIWVRVDPTVVNYLHIATISSSDQLVPAAGIVLICVGLFIFITGFFGCCGAAKENGCMLLTYAAILIFILILQVVAGILAAVFRNTISDTLKESMNMTVTGIYGKDNEDATTLAYDTMQINFKCCGAVSGTSDWSHSLWKQNNTDPVPVSCCVLNNNDPRNPEPKDKAECMKQAQNSTIKENTDFLNAKPCYQGFLDWLRGNIGILIGVAFGLIFIQVVGVVLACCLRKSIANQGTYA